jgi:hypothetical protein
VSMLRHIKDKAHKDGVKKTEQAISRWLPPPNPPPHLSARSISQQAVSEFLLERQLWAGRFAVTIGRIWACYWCLLTCCNWIRWGRGVANAMLFLNVYCGDLLMFGGSRHFIVRDLLPCTTAMVGLRSVACTD